MCRCVFFKSERSSRQSLQFLHPTHQNFNFISFSGRFGWIFCLFLMVKMPLPHKSSAFTASFRVRQPPNAPFALACPPTATTFAVWILKYATRRLILRSPPPISHFRWLLWDFFSLFQSCEIPITLSINSLRKSKVFFAFPDSPYFI